LRRRLGAIVEWIETTKIVAVPDWQPPYVKQAEELRRLRKMRSQQKRQLAKARSDERFGVSLWSIVDGASAAGSG
jgi:hypothetical protein